MDVHPTSNQISVSINGTSGLSLSTSNPPARFARTNLELTAYLDLDAGRHTISWGADLMLSRYNEYNAFQGSGAYSFNGRWYRIRPGGLCARAAFQLQPEQRRAGVPPLSLLRLLCGRFFRMTLRLTLNYGLRWEPYFPITDLNDREVQFDQADYLKGTKSTRYVNAPVGLYYPGDSPNGREIPRRRPGRQEAVRAAHRAGVGCHWRRPTSMRAGYGIFYDSAKMYVLNNMNLQAPFSFTVAFQNGLFDHPFQGRENLNVFPYSGDFQTNSPFQMPSSAVVYEPTWRSLHTKLELYAGAQFRIVAGAGQLRGTKATRPGRQSHLNAPIYDYPQPLSNNQATINAGRGSSSRPSPHLSPG